MGHIQTPQEGNRWQNHVRTIVFPHDSALQHLPSPALCGSQLQSARMRIFPQAQHFLPTTNIANDHIITQSCPLTSLKKVHQYCVKGCYFMLFLNCLLLQMRKKRNPKHSNWPPVALTYGPRAHCACSAP